MNRTNSDTVSRKFITHCQHVVLPNCGNQNHSLSPSRYSARSVDHPCMQKKEKFENQFLHRDA